MFHRGLFFNKRVYRLNEVREDEPERFGEKASTLARLVRLKLPVPDAFVVVSEAREVNTDRLSLSDSLKKQIKKGIEHLEESTGRHFFSEEESQSGASAATASSDDVEDAKFPLLLSVRQSPKHNSTPLFPTSLNLGFNEKVATRALKLSNRPLFVYDCWRRFIQDFGIHVLGISADKYKHIVESLCKDWGIQNASQASISQLKELVRAFSAVTPIPVDPFRQVTMTIEAVLRHHTSVGSSVYRSLQGGVEDQGISVIIQSQVFSNLTMLSSGHGSAYSRDPATGETISKVGMRGVYHSRAEGGDEVLPGSRELSLFKELRMLQPALYNDLVRAVQKVEQDFAAVVRVDFLVENGQAYVIHATPMLTLTPQAAMRAVVDYTKEDPERDTPPPLSHRDAVRRVDLQKVPSGEHELWTSDTNARKVLRWAKHMRQDLSCPGVLTEVRSMHDMHKGVQLYADSFGVVHLEDVLGSYFSEELVDVASPAKTAGERALALHSLRINLAGEIFSFLDNAIKARVGGGWPRMDVDSGAGAGETESVAVAGRVLTSPASSAADSESKRAAGCECDPCECNPCECTSTGRPCEHMPSVTIMLCEETRGHEATPAFLHPDFLQMQAHAATEAVLKAAAGMCLSCDKEVVPPHGEFQPCKAELNLAVPFGLGPVELDQCLAHAQAGVTAAEEDFDLQTIGSIIDDIPASCAAGATVRRAKDRLVVHFGVGISSPHGCFCTRAIASQRRVDFMVLDLDELTACALGNRLHPEQGPADCSPGPATCPGPDVGKTDAGYRVRRDQAMEAMMKKRLLPCDPYKSIDTSCVLPMVAKSAESAHKAALVLGKQVKILVSGAPSHDPSSLALLEGSVDAVIVPPAHLPVPLFAAAALGRDQNMGKYGTGGHLHSSSLPSAPSSIDKAPVDTGVMSPVKGAISSMFQSAKSGMRDLFQEEEEPFYFIA